MGNENANVAKAAGVVGLATALSRVFGFLRDMVVARYFGAGLVTDAFFAAFRIPNILRRLLAEGSLTVSFVPVFTEYLKVKSREEALELANVAFTLLSVVLVVVTIAGVILAPYLVALMTPGFMKIPDKFALTVFLTRVMFPYIFFVSLVALCMGILNSLRHFAAPALSPVVLNLGMIGATVFLKDYFREPILALAIGVIIGGFLQLVMQVPALLKMGVRLRLDFNFGHAGVRKIGNLMVPAAFGAAVYQINVFIGTLLASFLPSGSISYLYYADRVVELPLGVFAIALGTAALPSLSEFASQGKFEEMKGTLSFSLGLILFTAIPASIALIDLREPIISVLFQRGHFDVNSTILSAQALFYYSLGLWAFSAIRVVISGFYALQDTKTPVQVGIAALIMNTVLSFALMFPLRHGGLALATSLATAFNVGVLYFLLKKRIGGFLKGGVNNALSKILTSSAVMWLALFVTGFIFPWNNTAPFTNRALLLAFMILIGLVAFLLSATVLKSREMIFIWGVLKRRVARFR